MEENKFYYCGDIDEEFHKILDVLTKEFNFKHERVDTDTDKNVYYVINQNKLHNYCMFKLDFLSDEIKQKIKESNNFRIIIQSAHESIDDINLSTLKKYVSNNGLIENKFYLLNNSSNLKELQNKNGTKFNYHKLNYLSYLKINDMKNSTDSFFNEYKQEGKFFMSLNKEDKTHRYALLIFLMKNNLLEDTNWSFLPTHKMTFNSKKLTSIMDESTIQNYNFEIDYFINLNYKFSDYENNLEYNLENVLSQTMYESIINYQNSYVNLTTESVFDERESVVHITEKSFKPFYYYQFPLIMASENHIKKMKELYDFDFFEDIIDISYDDIVDDKERFKKFTEEIVRINSKKKDFMDFYKNNKNRFELNKQKTLQVLDTIKNDYQYFTNLI